MGRIKLLPDELAHKIAAGEVIERPASVVKELVENSIDANAARIEIEILDGGKNYIRVTDDGHGMEKDDITLAFLRHATSKVSSVEELFAIKTLGFRGEALPSIASVSELSLKSKVNGSEVGYKIVGPEHANPQIEPVAMGYGTSVEVRQLFYNTPARYKFLKTSPTEKRYIVELITSIAIAHPEIGFKLVVDGQRVLQTNGTGDLLEVLSTIYGLKFAKQLLPIKHQGLWGEIYGYIGPLDLARRNRQGQNFIINGRVIQSYVLANSLERGYQGVLPQRHYPFAVLCMLIEPTLIDVNVHPAKAEVRFQQEQQIYNDLYNATKQALFSRDLSPSFKPESKPSTVKREQTTFKIESSWKPTSWDKVDSILRQNTLKDVVKETKPPLAVESRPVTEVDRVKPLENSDSVRRALVDGRIIGQLHQTYILLEVEGGLWLLDQHIVHERILFEKYLSKDEQPSVQLLLAQTLEFSATDASLIQEYQTELSSLGIELETFGINSFLLRGLPPDLAQTGGWEKDIIEIVSHIKKGSNFREKVALVMSCKGAIKAGQYLDVREMTRLLRELAQTENPFTCPHGRPIIVKLDQQELLRRFGRSSK